MKAEPTDRPELAPRAAELVELARQSLGHMSARQRAQGLHGLRSRFTRLLRARTRRWCALAVCAGLSSIALTAVALSTAHALSLAP